LAVCPPPPEKLQTEREEVEVDRMPKKLCKQPFAKPT